MSTLIKILMIEYNKYYFILKMKYVFIGNTLQIECSYYQITNNSVVEIVKNTIKDNPENEQVLNTIQMQLVANIHLSQDRATEVYYGLTSLLQNNSTNIDIAKVHQVKLDTITTYLTIIQINSVKSFLEPFCTNYEQVKLNLQLLATNSPKDVKILDANQVEKPAVPVPAIINQPTAESTQVQPVDYIEEILINLSSSKLINQFIIKYLSHSDSYYEDCLIDQNTINIKMTSLIRLSLTGYSILNYRQLLGLIDSIEHQDAYTRLPLVCKDAVAIINDEKIDKCNKSISLQILTFLIFIYSIRAANQKLIPNNIEYPLNLTGPYTKTINNSLKRYIINVRNNNPHLKYVQVQFVENANKLIEMDNLNKTVQKYRYLVNFDKELFLKNVFIETTDPLEKKTVNQNLLFTAPKIIDIRKFIFESETGPTLLRYKLQDSKYPNHKVISEPYLHLLHIHYQNTMIMLKQLTINHVVSKYSDILLNTIYRALIGNNKEMAKYTNSTLIILEQYIRPYIKNETLEVELYLLFQILIPMLYDIDNTKVEYVDYFL